MLSIHRRDDSPPVLAPVDRERRLSETAAPRDDDAVDWPLSPDPDALGHRPPEGRLAPPALSLAEEDPPLPSLAAVGLSGPPRLRLVGRGLPLPSPVADPPEPEPLLFSFSLMGLGTMAWRIRIRWTSASSVVVSSLTRSALVSPWWCCMWYRIPWCEKYTRWHSLQVSFIEAAPLRFGALDTPAILKKATRGVG